MRIVNVFDDTTRPETTGYYVRRALKGMAEVEFFHGADMERIPSHGYDLYLAVDDGMQNELPDRLRPSAWWCIDTHVNFPWSLENARRFDLVFAAQRDGAEKLTQSGVPATWLPLACDPQIHRPVDVPNEYDVSFVGNLFPGPRTDMVRLIQQYFPRCFVGQAYFADMARIYSGSRAVLNRSLASDVNMRVFEALACRSLLLTNDLAANGQGELLDAGAHLEVYADGQELVEKLRFYLARPEISARVASAGHAEVVARHTYRHRMETLLAVVERQLLSPVSTTVPAFPCASNEKGALGPAGLATPADLASAAGQAKDPLYFSHARPEIIALVPATAGTVLEIGCGAGRLGEALKARQICRVVGVELDPVAAASARQRLDEVIEGNVETMDLPFGAAQFEVIVCGDVLEHLREPGKFLARAHGWLAPGGSLVASIPNVRHHSVVLSLLAGNWTYQPAGLLDETHLHFFTRSTIESLLAESGWQLDSLSAVHSPEHADWERQGRPQCFDIDGLKFSGTSVADAQELFVYQYLVVASPARSAWTLAGDQNAPAASRASTPIRWATRDANGPPIPVGADCQPPVQGGAQTRDLAARPMDEPLSGHSPRCLVLMVTFNRLDYTRVALESLLVQNYPDWRLVVWDNASTDGTVEYVRQRLKDVPHARLVASPENRGVVYPMNETWFSGEDAELLAKVDNDTRVPFDLLARLAKCHAASARFGVLSGFHFRKEGEGLVDDSRVHTFDGVRIMPQPYVGGCSVMVRREALKHLGPIPFRPSPDGRSPFMDSGWTNYQQRLTEAGYVNGYPWPPIHVDHMEDTRSVHCIRTSEHEQYKQELRGMTLEQFTQALCVWRPIWGDENPGWATAAEQEPIP